MKILVTGGAGFIGSSLVDRLLEAGHDVCVVDDFNDFYEARLKEANVAPHTDNPHYRLVRRDIRDKAALASVFASAGFETVVHLAARAGVRPSLADPELYYAVNVQGALNILELARKHNIVNFIFASSSSVYGNCDSPLFHEDLKIAEPISPYAATKLAVEHLTYVYSKLYSLQTICLRFFTVYGPRQRPDLAIAKFSALIRAGQPIPMYGDGTTLRDYTFIDDVIQGVIAAIHYNRTPYEIINLGGGEPVALRDMIAMLGEALGQPVRIEECSKQPGDVDKTAADISKAKRLLNYQPKTDFRKGLSAYINWLASEKAAAPQSR